jgi:glucosylglycerate phosphorylase
MKESIPELLEMLYGPRLGLETARALEIRLEKWAESLCYSGRPNQAHTLTERDVLLITYADQVTQQGQRPLYTLSDFCEQHLRDLFSGIHILPFYPWTSDDGFSVKDYYAVDPAYGRWEDLARLGNSFALMFDAVFNHMSSQSDWFQRFLRDEPDYRDFFVTVEGYPDLSEVVRPRALPLLTEFQTAKGPRRVWTTFSADQVDLNFKNPQVLLAVLDVLLFYVDQGAQFVRLDAIAYLWKDIGTPCLHLPQTHRIIQLIHAVLDRVAPHIQLITETNVPHLDNVSYFGDGTNEAQLVYNFALPPLVLHSLATGKATALSQWAATLATPSPQTAFFNFLASHDGLGLNPARGILSAQEIHALVERTLRHGGLVSYKNNPDGTVSPYELNITWYDVINHPASGDPQSKQVDRFMVSQAVMLALAGVPGVYVHSLYGSRSDRSAPDASSQPRRINRKKFTRMILEQDLAQASSLQAQIFARYGQLLRVRRTHSAFHPRAKQKIFDLDERLFVVWREAPDGSERLLSLNNVSDTIVPVAFKASDLGGGDTWFGLLPSSPHQFTLDQTITLSPYQVVWLSQHQPATT